jgi:hypothetical protein
MASADSDTGDPTETAEKVFCDLCGNYYDADHEARRHIVRSHTFDERLAGNMSRGEAPTAE